jgi:hypothetical protein
VRFVHVRREENAEADALANRAMDEGKGQEARSKKQESEDAHRGLDDGDRDITRKKPERGSWPPTGRLF